MKKFFTLTILALALAVGTAGGMSLDSTPLAAYQSSDPLIWLVEERDIYLLCGPACDGRQPIASIAEEVSSKTACAARRESAQAP